MNNKKYKRYHDYHFRADRNSFSWTKLKKKAESRGNSINEEINDAIQHWLLKHPEEKMSDIGVKK